jgi:flagellar biosynthesis/type III secretory pathway M-ring protein FliF/YscJ
MTLKAGEQQKPQKLLVHTAPILEKLPQRQILPIHVIIIRKGVRKRMNVNKIIWIDKTKIPKKRIMILQDFWVSCKKYLVKIILLLIFLRVLFKNNYEYFSSEQEKRNVESEREKREKERREKERREEERREKERREKRNNNNRQDDPARFLGKL